MPSISRHFWPCLRVLCEQINNERWPITYGELASKLGLKLAQQEWNTLLDLVAGKTKRELGEDYDLTWIVVYANGPAKNLGRYFSNGSKTPGSTLLDPTNMQQRASHSWAARPLPGRWRRACSSRRGYRDTAFRRKARRSGR
jgi:hypothetical protein